MKSNNKNGSQDPEYFDATVHRSYLPLPQADNSAPDVLAIIALFLCCFRKMRALGELPRDL